MRGIVAAVVLLGAAGCATMPSSELVQARHRYEAAVRSPAALLAPDRLYDAHSALLSAEMAHARDAGSDEERALAYVADRRAQIAMAEAELLETKQQLAHAEERLSVAQGRATQAELTVALANLERARTRLSEAEEGLRKERRARVIAERAAEVATRTLEQIARLHRTDRGLTITIPGQQLFAFGHAGIRRSGIRTLDAVARALEVEPKESKILIVGHTDSVGTKRKNLLLSQARADSVRRYLVWRGVDSSRVRAVGRGDSEPIADNDTYRGRAENRRVDIIVEVPDPASPNESRRPTAGK